MDTINIITFGDRRPMGCLAALEKEFQQNGHTIYPDGVGVPENTRISIIYDQNGAFLPAIECGNKYPNAIKIFNVLDGGDGNDPNWLGGNENAIKQLSQAHIVTTTAKSCADDIFNRTGIRPKVLYIPIKNIYPIDLPKTLPFIFVGRIYGPKRLYLAVETVRLLKQPPESLIIVGPEPCPENYGHYAGLIPDDSLNELYNCAKYNFMPCSRQGSLSLQESVLTETCIPLGCRDNVWMSEFLLDNFACDPNPEAMANLIINCEKNKEFYLNKLKELKPMILEKFHVSNVAKRIINFYYDFLNYGC